VNEYGGNGSRPIIEITPSPEQYRQLCCDLETLRAAGAESNTAAVIDAVHEGAHNARKEITMAEHKEMAGRRANAPGPEPRR
jgi:hypothetical protein